MTRPAPVSGAARLAGLSDAQDGATLVEFGLIAPMLSLLLIGAFDIGHTLYMQSVVQGAVQNAGRYGTLESASGTSSTPRDAIDQGVKRQILELNRNATIVINRRFYRTFSDAAAAKAEEFTDTSDPASPYNDGKCNNGEPFVDVNNNGRFDRDGADSADRAGARDNIVYTVTVTYPRMFPLHKLIGGSPTTRIVASTILANQPYGDQGSYAAPTTGHCGLGTPGVDQPAPDPVSVP
ncbi:MAG TPA: TadE family protein [Sphingobium sp.]|nr:TadE family protein [Sphingobium sp.]